MNRIYKVIWSKVKNDYVVVSEIAKRVKGKKKSETGGRKGPAAHAVSLFTALSFMLQSMLPAVAAADEATNIAPVQGMESTVTHNGGTYKIWAQKDLGGNIGLNQFDKFYLGSGDVANMYFQTTLDEHTLNTLVNFVNDQINVHGTLNAIRGGNIGGDLFFLSSQGMVVGTSGVINAGALTVLTPTEDAMKALLKEENQLTNVKEMIQNPGSVALNPSGTISVEGKINTYGNVNLYAGQKIDMAKGSRVKTHQTDFSDLVRTDNIGNLDASDTDNWELTKNQAGDIILSVKNNRTGSLKDNDIGAKAEIVLAGDLEGQNIRATAESNATIEFDDNKQPTKEDMKELNLANFIEKMNLDVKATTAKATSRAEVIVKKDANITAAKDLELNATSNLKLQAGVDTSKLSHEGKYAGLDPAASIVVVKTENDAVVEVKGKVEATGKLKIAADAASDVHVSAVEASRKSSSTESAEDKKVREENSKNAKKILDNAKSEDAKSSTDSDSNDEESENTESLVHAAIAVTNSHNKAEIRIESENEVKGGILDIQAKATEKLKTSAKVVAGDDTSALATAVNVTKSDSEAEINVKNTTLKSTSGDTFISATNTVEENSISGDNGIILQEEPKTAESEKSADTGEKADNTQSGEESGTSKSEENGKDDTDTKEETKEHTVLKIGGKVSDKVGKTLGNKTALAKKLGSTLDLGVSVVVADQTNDASVSLDNAKIEAADGKAVIQANVNINKNLQESAGKLNNVQKKDKESKKTLTADAAVLVSSMENTAEVSTTNGTEITAESIDIKSQIEMKDKLTTMLKNLEEAAATVKEVTPENWEKFKESIAGISDKLKNFQLFGSNDGGTNFSGIQDDVSTLNDKVSDASQQVNDTPEANALAQLGESLSAFKDIKNYLNYYVHTQSKTTGQEKDGGTLGLTGAINIASVDQSARTIIGEGTKLSAGTQSINATDKTHLISITGDLQNLTDTTGTSIGIGGGVGVTDVSSSAITAIGRDVIIQAKDGGRADSVAITSDNKIGQQDAVLGSGKTGTAGISGMVNVMTGYSDSITTVDDSVQINGTNTTIKAINDNLSTAVSGGVSLGTQKTAASVGAGIAVVNYDVNTMAVVGNNGEGVDTSAASADAATAVEKANKKRAKAIERAQKLLDTKTAYLGASEEKMGNIQANTLEVSAESSGMLNAVAIEAVKNSTQNDAAEDNGSDAGETKSAIDSLKEISDSSENKSLADTVVEESEEKLDKTDEAAEGKELDDAVNSGSTAANEKPGEEGSVTTENKLKNSKAEKTKTSVNIAGAGSVAITNLDGETVAILDNSKVTVQENEKKQGSVDIHATDESFNGDWAGAAAINWFNPKESTKESTTNSNTTVSIGGAVAANKGSRDVASIISNTLIENASSVTNKVEDNTTDVTAGLGLAVAKGGSKEGQDTAVSAAVSYHGVQRDNSALMVNDTVTNNEENTTDITNSAENNELQITGGLSAAVSKGGSSGASIGAMVAINDSKNDTRSVISSGEYTQTGKMDVTAQNSSTNIAAGATAAVSLEPKSAAAGGAIVYNKLENTTGAAIENGAEITADTVAVRADDAVKEKASEDYIQNRGIDTTGTTGTEELDGSEEKSDDKYKKKVDDLKELLAEEAKGSLIVDAALSLASAGKAGAGAAVNISDVKNTMTADVTDALITSRTLSDIAGNKTRIVSATGGIANAGTFVLAGSVGWNKLENSAKAAVRSSRINPEGESSLIVKAENDSEIINVAGQLSKGKVGIGMALAYNQMDNTTGAYLQSGTVSADTVTVEAQDKAKIASYAAGVTASEKVALSGAIALNRGANHTEAVVGNDSNNSFGRTELKDVRSLTVSTEDAVTDNTLAGGITLSGEAAFGGSVAYSDIGGSGTDSKDAKQLNQAILQNTDITTKDSGSITVKASDTGTIDSTAVGASLSGNVAIQGAAAVANINKNVASEVKNTNIDQGDSAPKNAAVTVAAENTAEINSRSLVAAASGTVAGGLGLAINRITQDTQANLSGGKQSVKSAKVQATGNTAIEAIGVGGAGAGTVAVSGSVAVNNSESNVKAHIGENADLNASGNVGVIAQSDDTINNYAGSVSGAGTAAIGATVAVNTLTGKTVAEVTGSTIVAQGDASSAIKTKSDLKDDAIINKVLSKDNLTSKGLQDKRVETAGKTGLVVDSSATHAIASVMATAGAAGTVAASGTVAVNNIAGATRAVLENTSVNKDVSTLSDTADVTVTARDYTNAAGVNVAIAGSGTVALGGASNTHTLDREVEAVVRGKGKEDTKLHVQDFTVESISKQGLSSTIAGAAVSANMSAAATVLVDKLKSKTKAGVSNVTVNYEKNAVVTADHEDKTHLAAGAIGGSLIGVSAAGAVSVLKQDSEVTTEVTDAEISTDKAGSSAAVSATNTTTTNAAVVEAAVSFVGAAAGANVSVNNFNQKVKTSVKDSKIKGSGVEVRADNIVNTDTKSGSFTAGVFGIGAGVAINTFNDEASTTIEKSTLITENTGSKDDEHLSVSAETSRNIKQVVGSVTGGVVGVGADVMVTSINEGINTKDKKLSEANDLVEKINSSSTDTKGTKGISSKESDILSKNVSTNISKGESRAEEGVHVLVKDSTLQSETVAFIGADENNAVSMSNDRASIGVVSVNAGVNILNAKHKTDVTVEKSKVTGTDVVLMANQTDGKVKASDGTEKSQGIEVNITQGTGGAIDMSAAYAKINNSGDTRITANDSTITATDGILAVMARDDSSVTANTVGLSVGAVTAGAIISEVENESNTGVNLTDVSMTAEPRDSVDAGYLLVHADKENTVKATVVGGRLGLATGSGLSAKAEDNGTASINLNTVSQGNILRANTIGLQAISAPQILAESAGVAAGVSAAQNTRAEALMKGGANVTVAEGSSFAAENTGIMANVGSTENSNAAKVTAKYTASTVAGLSDSSDSGAYANSEANVNVDVKKANYDGTKKLSITGESLIERRAEGDSLDVGILAAEGTVVAKTEGKDSIEVKAGGNTGENTLDSLTVGARAHEKATAKAVGSGGGLTNFSPVSADAVNIFGNSKDKSSSKAVLSGNWKAGTIDLDANYEAASNITSRTAKASAAGYDGAVGKTEIKDANKEYGTIAVIDGDASLTAETLDVDAKNNIATSADMNGLSITVAGVTASSMESKEIVDKYATISIGDGAKVSTTGTQTYTSDTEGDFSNTVKLDGKGVGVSNNPFATAVEDITVHNTVESSGTLINQGRYEDGGITLAAYDNLGQKINASAEGALSAVSWVSSKIDNTVKRNNTVDVKAGEIISDRDLNLYAGTTDKQTSSDLSMELNAASYNYGAIPAESEPSIKINVNENNKVNVAAKGKATRHINVIADGGRTDIHKSVVSYNWVQGGESTEKGFVSSKPGTSVPGITKNNMVSVNGTLEAGVKNKLDIRITETGVPGVDDISVEAPEIYKSDIKSGSMDYANSLKDRWDELKKLINEYSSKENDEYKTAYLGYLTELDSLEARMESLGLLDIDTDSKGNIVKSPRRESLTVKYVEIPDLVASGGDINIRTDDLSSEEGHLIANGSPKINITNDSSYMLRLNDVIIAEKGGSVRFNDKEISAGDKGNEEINQLNRQKGIANFKEIKTDSSSTGVSSITIANNYDRGAQEITINEEMAKQFAKEIAEAREELNVWYNKAEENLAERYGRGSAEYNEALALLDVEKNKNEELLNEAPDKLKEGQTITYTPISNVEIGGEINNMVGDVHISTKRGDIVISSGTSTQSTGVQAAGRVELVASNGSIQQSFKDGIVNIDSSPEEEYKESSRQLEKDLIKNTDENQHGVVDKTLSDLGSDAGEITRTVKDVLDRISKSRTRTDLFTGWYDSYRISRLRDTLTNSRLTLKERYLYAKAIIDYNSEKNILESGDYLLVVAQGVVKAMEQSKSSGSSASGYIAGGNVYIAATDINVNGLIQSGYDTYSAEITQSMVDAAKLGLTDAVNVDGRTMYKVNPLGGTAVWDSVNNKYNYEVAVYYDKLTDKLVVADIDVKGGNIHLTGKISSTGNGSLSALDGGANIEIVNNSNMDLQVGNIYNNDVKGQVVITDTNKNIQTTFTGDKTTVIENYTEYLKDKDPSRVTVNEDKVYKPEEGIRYNWTQGTQTVTSKTYEKTTEKTWWGLHDAGSETELKNYEKYIKPTTAGDGKTQTSLDSGVFIKKDTSLDSPYSIIYDNVVLTESRTEPDKWVTKSGFLGWRKTYHTRWTTTTGSKQSYVHSLKADNQIDINFQGQENGYISLSNAGEGKTLQLAGNIRNHTADSDFAAKSQGDIIQETNAVIQGNNISLEAQTGIDHIKIRSMGTQESDTVHLDATTRTGDVQVEVQAGSGLVGNVELFALKAEGNGNVSLTADGSITQMGDAVTVKGNRIDLKSSNGHVGSLADDGTEQALVIHAGQDVHSSDTMSASVNVAASGNINLEQRAEAEDKSDGNLRVGTIRSTNGDVKLTAMDGHIVDATSESESSNDLDIGKRIEGWIRDGRIKVSAENKTYLEMKEKATEVVKDRIEADYKNYLNLKEYYADAGNIPENAEADKLYQSYKEYEDRFQSYASAEDYIAAVKGEDGLGTDGSYYSELMTQELGDDSEKWTQEQLLYAVNDAITNKTTGSTDDSAKRANIFGKNIILNSQGIGLNNEESEIITIDQLSDLTDPENLEALKKLSRADFSDVERITAEDGKTITGYKITGKTPVGVYATGTVSASSTEGENIYLAARSNDKDMASKLVIDTVEASAGSKSERGSVRILGKAGVEAANTEATTADIIARDLLIEGGNEDPEGKAMDIGTEDRYIQVDLTGDVSVRTSGSSYIRNVGESDLVLGASYAGKELFFDAAGHAIRMNENEDAYLNAVTAVHLDGATSVGTADNAVRILANDSGIYVNTAETVSADSIYLAGKLGMAETGTLRLENLKATDTISVTSDDKLVLGGTDSDSTVQAENVSLEAKNDLRLESGLLEASNAALKADKITQSKEHQAKVVESLSLTAENGIDFAGAEGANANVLHEVTVKNTSDEADVLLVGTNAAEKSMEVTFAADSKAKNVTVKNLSGDLAVKGSVQAKENASVSSQLGSVTTEDVTAGETATISGKSDVVTSGSVSAKDVNIQSTEGAVTTNKVTATNTATIAAKGHLLTKDTVSGTNGVKLTSESGNIDAEATVESTAGDVSMTAVAGTITTKAVRAGNDASILAGKNVETSETVSGKNVNIQSTDGSVNTADYPQ